MTGVYTLDNNFNNLYSKLIISGAPDEAVDSLLVAEGVEEAGHVGGQLVVVDGLAGAGHGAHSVGVAHLKYGRVIYPVRLALLILRKEFKRKEHTVRN